MKKVTDILALYRESMRVLEQIIRDDEAAPTVRLDAVRIYLEWHRPKPRQALEITEHRPSREESAQALAEYIAQIQEDRPPLQEDRSPLAIGGAS